MPRTLPSLLAPVLLAVSMTTARALPQTRPSDRALAPLAEAFASYFEARSVGEGVEEAWSELRAALSHIAGEEGHAEAALVQHEALARAAWLSRAEPAFRLTEGKVRATWCRCSPSSSIPTIVPTVRSS